ITLVYCGLVFVLVKIKLLKPTLLVKLSPVAFFLIVFLCLFVPMMFWAPSGNVIITKEITRITPQVGGTIIKVHVQGNERVTKGAPLISLDPAHYKVNVYDLSPLPTAAT